jgi:hypothetical protein
VAYESGDETMRIVPGFDHGVLFDPATLGVLTTLIGNDEERRAALKAVMNPDRVRLGTSGATGPLW